nr:succinate dehydrogenase subunit 3 [Pleonosporium sp.]
MWILQDEFFQHFNRPLSPNLLIYKLQISALLSIWHRFTGVLMSVIFFYYILHLKILVNFFYTTTWKINLYPTILHLIYISLTLVFLYHFINGCRYILTNFGIYFKK